MVLGEQLDRWFKKREQERVDRAVKAANDQIERLVALAAAEARAEARAEERRLWSEWNQRRMNAAARGASFDERPPDYDPTAANGSQQES